MLWSTLQQHGHPENKQTLLQNGSKRTTTATLTHTPARNQTQHPPGEARHHATLGNLGSFPSCFALLLCTAWNKCRRSPWRQNVSHTPRAAITISRQKPRLPPYLTPVEVHFFHHYWKQKAVLRQHISKNLLNTSLPFKAQQEPWEPPSILTSEQCKPDISSCLHQEAGPFSFTLWNSPPKKSRLWYTAPVKLEGGVR